MPLRYVTSSPSGHGSAFPYRQRPTIVAVHSGVGFTARTPRTTAKVASRWSSSRGRSSSAASPWSDAVAARTLPADSTASFACGKASSKRACAASGVNVQYVSWTVSTPTVPAPGSVASSTPPGFNTR